MTAMKEACNISSRQRVTPAPLNHKCICSARTSNYLCGSRTCRNDRHRNEKGSKPTRPAIAGSVTVGLVDTDESSPRSAIRSSCPETPPQTKPRCQQAKANEEWMKMIPGIIGRAKNSANNEVIDALKRAAEIITADEYCVTDDGQSELLKMTEERAKPPSPKERAVASL